MSRRPVDAAHHPFVKALVRGLRGRCGVREGDRLLVAVSGGADSVALLRGLAALGPRRGWNLAQAVGHVQHHLRAARHAEADARFVARLAGELGLPFYRADLKPPGAKEGVNREAWARAARYEALAAMAREFRAAGIVTAHHADDQWETLVMRMLRGTSVRGLGGMRWRRRLPVPSYAATESGGSRAAVNSGGGRPDPPLVLLRPMLGLQRDEIRGFLGDFCQTWREDHTNADTTRLRAALRHKVLPLLRELQPDAARKAAQLADHSRQMARLLEGEIAAAAERVKRGRKQAHLGRDEARRLPRVVLIGLLRRLLTGTGVPGDCLGTRTMNPIVRAIRDSAGGRRRFTLRGGVRVVVEGKWVSVGD